MSRKERAILLVPQGKGMVAYSVHEAEDLISLDDVLPGKSENPTPEMVKIALQLIDQKSGEFDVSYFTDRYGVRLRELLDAKMAGEDLPPIEAPKTNVIDLMSALKESVKRKERPAKKMLPKIHAASFTCTEEGVAMAWYMRYGLTKVPPRPSDSPSKRWGWVMVTPLSKQDAVTLGREKTAQGMTAEAGEMVEGKPQVRYFPGNFRDLEKNPDKVPRWPNAGRLNPKVTHKTQTEMLPKRFVRVVP